MIEETTRGERAARLIASAACAVLAVDLAMVVVTGGLSILTPRSEPSPLTFALREGFLALALVARFRVLASPERRLSAGQITLMLSVIPSLFHLHVIGRRITGDALYYYVFTRSMMRDADVNFANEYEHYGLLNRDDHSVPTQTGHIRTIYSVGPGLLWTPFFAGADVLAAALKATGFTVNTSGYGPLHLNAVALGSFSFGIAALFVIHAFLRRHFGDRLAGGTVLLLWWASFLPFYLGEQPLTSHPASILLVATFFLLRQNQALASPPGSFAIGLTLGLGMSVRWQNGVYLLLPAIDLLAAWRGRASLWSTTKRSLLAALGVFLGALPQMLAWKAIYGDYLLAYPPQGTEFVRLFRPFLLNTLFSSRHGLFSWTPVFWPCLLGLAVLTRRNPRHFAILWAPVAIVTWVNACTGDWWAGGAFSNRRFDSLLPVFALGLAASLSAMSAFVQRRPASVPAALVLGGAVWTMTFAASARVQPAQAAPPMSFGARSLASASVLSRHIGFPTTWPASWIFAALYRTTPDTFDLAAGKYLFYRQNNLNGLVDLGLEGDDAMALDGFSGPKQDGGIDYRALESEARLIVSLDLPEALGITVQARTVETKDATVDVLVNGNPAGRVRAQPVWSGGLLKTPQHLWARGPNVVTLRSSAPIQLDRVTFERRPQ